MKEKEIIELAVKQLQSVYRSCAIWKSPSFKHLSWDIFGIYDLVVATTDGQIIFIQVTTTPNLAARRKKMNSFYHVNGFVIPNSYIWAWDKLKSKFVVEKL